MTPTMTNARADLHRSRRLGCGDDAKNLRESITLHICVDVVVSKRWPVKVRNRDLLSRHETRNENLVTGVWNLANLMRNRRKI